MFLSIYGKRLLSCLRDKELLIWTWIFPIVLSTLFYATFSNLDTVGLLSIFPLGVVDDEAYRQDAMFRSALESVSGEDGLFVLNVFSGVEEADTALENGDIDGYILAGEKPLLVVADDGITQTIAKGFLDRYLQTKSSVALILAQNPGAAQDLPALLTYADFTEEISLTQNPPSNKVSYFYALLALACLYGGFQGQYTVTYLQANLSALGARRTLAPIRRFRLYIYDLMAGITIQVLGMITVVLYITLVLRIDFGSKLGLVLLTCLIGSILGVAFGAMISAVSKMKEMAKTAILVAFTMVCSFLSGLMVGGINYIIAERAPVVSWLNPAARISDAFYALYYYDTYERYLLNIGIILAMAIAMFLVTAIFLRRQSYESI